MIKDTAWHILGKGIALFILSLSSSLQAQWGHDRYKQSVINDPAISLRCEELLQERNQKVDQRSRLEGLIERNRRLKKLTPPHRQTLLTKLQKNYGALQRELDITLDKIQRQEENIIRVGCPGINITVQ